MPKTELSDAFGRQLAAALGRPATEDETAFAAALASLRRTEGVSLLRIDAVMARTGLGRSSIYSLAAENRFPKPVQVAGARVAVWSDAAVSAWIAEQLQREEA